MDMTTLRALSREYSPDAVREGDTIAVWFSCGAASAVAARRTVDRYGNFCNVRILNNPVIEEDEDNLRFLADVERWLGRPIERVINPNYPAASAVDVWERRKFMSGPRGAACTVELKKRARQIWEGTNTAHWHVLGFTSEEQVRHDRFVRNERSNVIPVLIEDGLRKIDCYRILQEAGIEPPRTYAEGWPNANCKGCVKATSPTYWNFVRGAAPEVFQARAEQSRRLGVKLVRHKGKRIHLDELPADAKGAPMKNLDFECGLFCQK